LGSHPQEKKERKKERQLPLDKYRQVSFFFIGYTIGRCLCGKSSFGSCLRHILHERKTLANTVVACGRTRQTVFCVVRRTSQTNSNFVFVFSSALNTHTARCRHVPLLYCFIFEKKKEEKKERKKERKKDTCQSCTV